MTPYRAIGAVVASAFLAAQPSTVYGRRAMDDYAGDNAPRALSQAYFAAVSTNQGWKVVSQKAPLQESADEESAYFTEDGGISIPPRAMIVFRNAGKCMDPHLPAPRNGEPMQFVNTTSCSNAVPVAIQMLRRITSSISSGRSGRQGRTILSRTTCLIPRLRF